MTIKNTWSRSDQYKWIVLVAATLAQACSCFFVQGFGSIALSVKEGMALSDLQIGLLVSAAQIVPLFGLLIAGELLDRYSERFVVGVGALIVGASLCAATYSGGYGILLAQLAMLGLGYSTAQPGGSKSVSGWFSNKQLGFAMGIRQAGLPIGGAMATLALPFVVQRYSYRAAFLCGGLVAIAGGIVFMLLYRAPASASKPVKKDVNLRQAIESRLSMAREPSMINIMMSGTSLTATQYGVSVFLVLYLRQTVSLSTSLATALLFIVMIFGAIGRILLAAWSDHCSRGRFFPVLTCLLGAAISMALLPMLHTSNLVILFTFAVFTGLFTYGWYGPWVAYVAHVAPEGRKGFALGMAMTANQVGVVLVPPIVGWANDASGTYTYGWIGLALLSLFVLYAAQRRVDVRVATELK